MNFKKLTGAILAGALCLGFTAMGDSPAFTGDDFASYGDLSAAGTTGMLLKAIATIDPSYGWSWEGSEEASAVVTGPSGNYLNLDTESEELTYTTDAASAGMTFEIKTTFMAADSDGLEALDSDVKVALMAWAATNSAGDAIGTNLMAWVAWDGNSGAQGWYPLVENFDATIAHTITVKASYASPSGGGIHFLQYEFWDEGGKINTVDPLYYIYLSGWDNTCFKSVSFKGTGKMDYFTIDETQDSFKLIMESMLGVNTVATTNEYKCALGTVQYFDASVENWDFVSAEITAFNNGSTTVASNYVTIVGNKVTVDNQTQDGWKFTVTATYVAGSVSPPAEVTFGGGATLVESLTEPGRFYYPDVDFKFTTVTTDGDGFFVADFDALGHVEVIGEMTAWLKVTDKLINAPKTNALECWIIVTNLTSGLSQPFSGSVKTKAPVDGMDYPDGLFVKDIILDRTTGSDPQP